MSTSQVYKIYVELPDVCWWYHTFWLAKNSKEWNGWRKHTMMIANVDVQYEPGTTLIALATIVVEWLPIDVRDLHDSLDFNLIDFGTRVD